MTARAAHAGGQSTTAGKTRDAKRSCSDDQAFQSIPFHLGSHVCWAVRPDNVDLAYPNGERGSGESEARTLCGWLRIGSEAYLVLTLTEKVDDVADPASDKTEPWRILSEREMQIAMLVTLGKGTKQIAGHLQISEHTVQSYMRRIFFKLHVSTRTAMVGQLLRSRIGLANLEETPSTSGGRR
jgi:DNA-binding CsgD family transcriptional regulator